MSTLSVPLTGDLEKFINDMVASGVAANKADVVRKALRKYAEDQAVEMVHRSMQEYKEGKALKGDLRDLLKKIQ